MVFRLKGVLGIKVVSRSPEGVCVATKINSARRKEGIAVNRKRTASNDRKKTQGMGRPTWLFIWASHFLRFGLSFMTVLVSILGLG